MSFTLSYLLERKNKTAKCQRVGKAHETEQFHSDVLPGSDASLSQVWNPGLPVFVDAARNRQSERRPLLFHQLHHRAAPKLIYITPRASDWSNNLSKH